MAKTIEGRRARARVTSVALAAALGGCTAAAGGASLDPASGPGGWRAVRPLPDERFEGYAAVARGRLYFLGGITDVCADGSAACESDRVDVYDPAADAWTGGPPLPPGGARHHLAVAVLDDRIYVLGGFVGILEGAANFGPVAATFVLDGGGWRRLADQPIARGAATAQAIGGLIFVVGGGTREPDARADLYAYDPVADGWRAARPMPTAREHLASCVVGDKLLAVGGWDGQKQTLDAAELYDPATDGWTALPPLAKPRGGLGAAALGGVCYAVGGEQWVGPLPGTFADDEAFDPALGRWTSFAPMPTRRHGLGLAALGAEIYAVAGGPVRGNSYDSVAEAFAP